MFEKHIHTVQRLAKHASQFDFIQAITVSGSIRNGYGTEKSDVDTYVYITRDISPSERETIINIDVINKQAIDFWGASDYFIDAQTGVEVDFMYFRTDFIESELNRPLEQHQANIGYSTAFWHTIKQSLIIYDKDNWFTNLQVKAKQPYPDELVHAIITKNFPILRDIATSYKHQIAKAITRQDLISINHRISAFLASYFDVLFAVNKVTHTGEKRLMQFALQCAKQPENMQADINSLLNHSSSANEAILEDIENLVENLRDLITMNT